MREDLTDFTQQLSDPDPVRRAQIAMKKPLPKRFYAEVSVSEGEGGFAVKLDGRPVKTPARNALAVPNATLAAGIAEEWRAQVEVIDPMTMPLTRMVNTAIDGIASDPQAVSDDIVRYAGIDLLCYRAATPTELVRRQAERWDPVLAWAAEALGATFLLVEGVMHREQPKEAVDAFRQRLSNYATPLQLAGLHTMTTLMGSAILSLAFAESRLSAEDAWSLAHLDEDWTSQQWGSDAEAEHRRALRLAEFMTAADVFRHALAE
ncbi:ATP12 family chaperone protein [Rhizobium sp. HT1-10]|uniref:ATP12 family chaperone protein n=1 Tax=Rhizobium sp. HT1-10 TaxID=3111638 RepID=UPI003C16B645